MDVSDARGLAIEVRAHYPSHLDSGVEQQNGIETDPAQRQEDRAAVRTHRSTGQAEIRCWMASRRTSSEGGEG
jgi:hypothetical protein